MMMQIGVRIGTLCQSENLLHPCFFEHCLHTYSTASRKCCGDPGGEGEGGSIRMQQQVRTLKL